MMLKKTLQNFKDFGLSVGSLYSLNRILGIAGIGDVYYYRIVAQPILEKKQLPSHRGRQIETRWLERDDPSLRMLPRPDSVIKSRFDQQSRCLGAFIKDQLVGCLWYVETRYREDEVRCDFVFSDHVDCVWDYDVYVDPQYRIGFVFLRLWDDANDVLYQSGYRWSLSRISGFNLDSVRAHARLGAKDIGGATFLTLGKRQWCWSTFFSGLGYSANINKYPVMEVRVPAELRENASRENVSSLDAVK